MTAASSLPLLQMTVRAQAGQGVVFGIAFSTATGPADLSGLTFTLKIPMLGVISQGLGSLLAYDGVVLVSIRAYETASWQRGVYQMILTASDGQNTAPIFSQSRLYFGLGGPTSLVTLTPTAITAAVASAQQIASLGSGGGGSGGGGGGGLSGALTTVEFTGAAAGQSIAVPNMAGGFGTLVVNGLVENPNNYSLSNGQLVIPAGVVWDGAPCFFVYPT